MNIRVTIIKNTVNVFDLLITVSSPSLCSPVIPGSYMFQTFSRHASRHCICRNILCDDRAGGNYRMITDGDAG